jgi:hypothetical protein
MDACMQGFRSVENICAIFHCENGQQMVWLWENSALKQVLVLQMRWEDETDN